MPPVLFWIVLPLSQAVIAVMVLYYGIGIWNSWFWASAILRNRELYPLREILLQNSAIEMAMGSDAGDQESVANTIKYATIIAATVPTLCVYPFLQKYFARGVMIGGVKE
jgi:putative aldouronate transport system permease protein